MAMRELKFRAWDGKKIFFPGHFSVNNKKDKCLSFSSFELTQYTGIKDKNGNDIYEGDLIEVTGYVDGFIKNPSEVIFEEKEGAFGLYDNRGGRHNLGTLEVEVVGNIYEKAELKPE